MADQPHPRAAFLNAPSLVGRERELATLREALDAALAGHGSLVLIGGEAGIGKTALAERLLAEASAEGALVLVGRCYDLMETPPYGPWAEALADVPRTEAFPPPDLGGAAAARQAALFAAVREYLVALATARPLVLLLEDLHWADPASLDLLRVLARRGAERPVLLLATYRADEVAPDHPLHALLPLLVREARAARLDLRPLDATAIGALIDTRYTLREGDRVRLTGYLAGRTEGNALFLGELLRTLKGEGLLRREGDAWALGDLDRTPVPTLLQQLIAGRVGRLGPEIARLLAVAAVIGQAVPLALWAAVAGVAEDELLEHSERAVAARLLTETPDGTAVRFAHALIREALYAGTPTPRRRAWHRRAGEALLDTSSPDPDAVADHLRRAGDPRAVEWLVRAGERAARLYAWRTAGDRFAAALALTPDDADPGERGWLLYQLGAYRRWTDPEAGAADLTAAECCAVLAEDRALAAVAVFTRGLVYCFGGRLGAGLDDLQRGVDARRALAAGERARLEARALAEDTGDRTDGQGTLAQWLVTAGRMRHARFVGERALAEVGAPVAAGSPPARSRADTDYGLAQAYAGLGLVAESLRAYCRSRAAYRAAGHWPMVGVTAQNEFRWTVAYRADRPAGLRQLLAEAAEAWAHAPDSVSDWQQRYPESLRHLLDGHWAAARHLLLAGANPGAYPLVGQWLAPIARAQGDTARAWGYVHATLPDGAATAPLTVSYPSAIALLGVAVGLALDAGDQDAAHAWLAAHDRWVAWSESAHGPADGALLWARYYRTAGDMAAARQHAERALALAGDPRQPLALLAAHRALAELDTAAGRHADARTHLAAALALATACEAPFARALTLLALAELRGAAGDRAGAAGALGEARALLTPLDARPALARAAAIAARLAAVPAPTAHALPFGLTPREAEVLALLAEGLTDPQIAARLFVSRNTVAFHTKAIFGKLGVTTRAAAARLATERGRA